MKHFISALALLLALAAPAHAGIMPSLELSGTGIIISATKVGQIVNVRRVSATEVSSTTADIITLRGVNVSLTGIVTATTFNGALAYSRLTGVATGVQNISNTALTTQQLSQLANISTTITSPTWNNVGALNQSVATTATPTFAGLAVSGTTGLNVSGSVIISGNISSSGVVTATAFAGDGSRLSNVNLVSASSISISGSVNAINTLSAYGSVLANGSLVVSSSFNIAGSIQRLTGYYDVSFSTPFADTNYVINITNNFIETCQYWFTTAKYTTGFVAYTVATCGSGFVAGAKNFDFIVVKR